jgi:hypothetical protein
MKKVIVNLSREEIEELRSFKSSTKGAGGNTIGQTSFYCSIKKRRMQRSKISWKWSEPRSGGPKKSF